MVASGLRAFRRKANSMASIWQVTWRWAGLIGGTGYTNLYYAASTADGAEALAACTKSRLLFDGVKTLIPTAASISLQGDVKLLEDTTGDIVNIFTVSGPAAVTGTGSGTAYAGGTGVCVDWLTGVVHGKHLMMGRTFFVPTVSTAFVTGVVAPGTLTTFGTAAEAMRTATGPAFGVWGRPRAAKALPGGGTSPALTGHFANAISSRIPQKAVVLRSRRD